jgi:anti-sigma B factor antagonist
VELLSIEQGSGIRLVGELDMSTAPRLDEALQEAVERGGPFLVDITELAFMDSSGIHCFVKAALALGERGCIILYGEAGPVRTVLDLAQLDGSVPSLQRVRADGGRPTESANGAGSARRQVAIADDAAG